MSIKPEGGGVVTDPQEARKRVIAYLDEMDRVDNSRPHPQYHDVVHGINDFGLRRSDLRTLTALKEVVPS